MLPNFLCIGVQKAGTTWLYHILRQHPEIFLPVHKELHYFDIEKNYSRGIDWYRQHFVGAEQHRVVGEMTPIYIYYRHVAERIRTLLGDRIRLLIVLRNPVDRAYSHYWMSFRRKYETLSFEEAIMREPERMKMGDFERRHFSYISRGKYAEQIRWYLKYFDRARIHIALFEELIAHPAKVVRKLLEFLDCDTGHRFDVTSPMHTGYLNLYQYWRGMLSNGRVSPKMIISFLKPRFYEKKPVYSYPPMRDETRRRLFAMFADDISDLQTLLDAGTVPWAESPGDNS